ncbi:hydantoinase B/oxoprolinase family protein [Roseibium algae]|uniref:Hydantoinase B/oxoprolinase family protein n=1 Tax=Roseibium algae TaxID=3123038 RepID=A0ABU8TQU6_9HYPH
MDPITLETLWTRMISIVDEGAAAMLRSSFSTVVRDSYDFSVIITDRTGNSLVQATDSLPSFIGTLPRTVRAFLKEYPANTLKPGDVLITNDMYDGTGHLPDISVARPIFYKGELIAFAASTAHAPDIGGKIRSPEPREIFEEGLQIPMLKLFSGGQMDQTLRAFLRKNVRVPDLVEGDLAAQTSTLELIERGIHSLMAQYHLQDLKELSHEIRTRAENALATAIAAVPDGSYSAEMETDGLTDSPITLRVKVTIKGNEVSLDFAGSSQQVPKAINCAYCYTLSMSAYAIKCALAPDIPNNEGFVTPISVEAPERSIVNPVFPASGGSRVLIGHYIPSLIFQALAEVIPERVLAASGSPIWCLNLASLDSQGRPQANLFFFNGGMGAASSRDGIHCMSWPGNISATPSEAIDQTAPLHVVHKKIIRGSGGAGRYRGGDGQSIMFEYSGNDGAAISFLSERTTQPAPGIQGGLPGNVGYLRINGKDVDPKSQHILKQGDRIEMGTPGGGGYGHAS